MVTRRDIAIRARRVLDDLRTLGTASAVVLAVAAFTLVSIGNGAQTQSSLRQGRSSFEARPKTVVSDRTAQLYMEAQGLTGPPVVYAARVSLKRWQGTGRRVVEARVDTVEPVESGDTLAVETSQSASVAQRLSERLRGRKVLAAVTPEAARKLQMPGEETVRLVVTPQGATATLLIDAVMNPGEGSGVTMSSAETPVVGETASVRQVLASEVSASASRSTKPFVSSLSRYWGRPGTRVTIQGRNFGRPSSTRWVTSGGVRAKTTSWSSTSITFVVPTKMTKAGYAGVVTPVGTSNGVYYTPFDPPVVTSVSPDEGAPGTIVTITGSRFGSSQRSGWVTFAGRSAEVVSWSSTSIRAVIPRGAEVGYAGVVANGLVSNGTLYGPYGMPSVTGISNRSMHVGMQVRLTGRDFGSAAGRVVFGGALVSPDSWTPTEVRFTVPASVANGYIGIQRQDGVTSNGIWGSIVPRLDAVSTWWASPGSTVTLSGAGFGAVSGENQAFVAGRPATALAWSDSSIVIRVPDDAVSGYVGVGTLGAVSRGRYLLVETRAQIDSVTPRMFAAGEQITVTGRGFGPQLDTSKVLIAGLYECLVVEWTDTKIVAIIPPGALSGYVGVTKRGVTSNGVWAQVLP